MLWDTHMHSHFSGDSQATPESMIAAAREKGLAGICFTDHLDLDYPNDPKIFSLDVKGYLAGIKATDTKAFSVYTGIELGLQPHLAARHHKLLQTYNFDFVIGSTHVVHGVDPYYPVYYENRTEDEAYREYLDVTLENIRAFDGFDVYGHIDYVVRYGPNKNKFYSYEKFADIIDDILRELIARGKGIEINTGGFKYGLNHPNPTEAILKRYRSLGGEIITIGSDAHKPEHVGYDFHRVPEILKEAGFGYYTVFHNRKPEFLPL